MVRRKAYFHAITAPMVVCLMMLCATHQAGAQGPESENRSPKNADLVREIEQLRAELERTRAQVASLTEWLEHQAQAEKQKQREEHLNVIRRDLLDRTRQLEDARIQLSAIDGKEKALEKTSLPPDKLSYHLNQDAVIQNSRKEIARLQDFVAEFKRRTPQPEAESAYKRAVAQIEKLEESVQARKEKARSDIERDWRDSIRESLAETRNQLKDRLALLTASTKKLAEQFENAAKQLKQSGGASLDNNYYNLVQPQFDFGGDAALLELERAKEQIKHRFDRQRQEVMKQLKLLDEEQQRALADVDRRAQILRERSGQRREAGGGPANASKLDQILERLQRIEMRLEQLERSPRRPSGASK